MAPEPTSPDEQNARLAMRAIRMEIKRILDSWDPLALRGLQGFRTEYDQYAGPLAVLVRKGAQPMEIARHLLKLQTEQWGLPEDRAKCLQVAEKVHRAGNLFGGGPAESNKR